MIDRKAFKKILCFGLIFAVSVVGTTSNILEPRTALAAVNQQINYQGKLMLASTGAAVPDASYNIEFKLYTVSSGGTAIWTEDWTSGNKVPITSGLFSVMLGSITTLSGINFDQTLYLGVNIGGTSTPSYDGEMAPRKTLGAVPAAFEAVNLGGASSTQYMRADLAGTLSTTSAGTLFTVNQIGAGAVVDLQKSGASYFTVLNNGNVGIGSSTPAAFLGVNGSAYFGGNITATGTISAASSTFSNFTAGSIAFFATGGSLNQNNTNFFWDNTDARLGIGTTTPGYALTVTGDENLIGALRFGGNAGTNGFILQTTGSGANWVSTSSLGIVGGSSQWITSGLNILYNTGNVGIGTSTPVSLLSVAGETRAANFVAYSTTSTSTFLGDVVVGTGGGAGDSVFQMGPDASAWSMGYFQTDNSFRLASSTDLVSNVAFTVLKGGNVGIGTTTPAAFFAVGGNSYFGGNITATGTISAASSTFSNFTAGSIPFFAAGGSLNQNNSKLFWDNTNARLGIGTTTPGAILSIAGQPGAVTQLFDVASSSAASYFHIISTGNIGVGTTTPGFLLTVAGTSLHSGNALFNSNVGIGSSTPSSQLSVSSVAALTSDQITFTNANNPVTTAGVSGLQLTYAGGAAAIEAGAERIDLTPGATAGGTWNGLRIVANATGPGQQVTENALKIQSPTAFQNGGTFFGFNFVGTGSGAATGTLAAINIGTITTGSATQTAAIIGSGWATDLSFLDTAATIQLPALGSTSTVSSLTVYNSSSTKQDIFSIKVLPTNFGGLVTSGAFNARNSYFAEEYNKNQTDTTGQTTNAGGKQLRGDNSEITYGVKVSTATASCTFQMLTGSANGFERLNALGTATPTNAACIEELGSAAATTTTNSIFSTTNLPVITMKAETSIADTNHHVFLGLSDQISATSTMPASGEFFSNCGDANCASGVFTNWIAVVKSTTNIATSSCGAIVTSKFAYFRIEVRAAADIHFFIDTDTSNGTTETECGTGISLASNTAAQTMLLDDYSNNATATLLDVDYFRVWQDDNVAPVDETTTASTSGTTTPVTMIDGLEVHSADYDKSILQKFIEDPLSASSSPAELDTDRLAAGLSVVTPRVVTQGLIVDSLSAFDKQIAFNNDIVFFGRPYFNTDTAGFAVIKQGSKDVQVDFSEPYLEQPIVNATISLEDSTSSVGVNVDTILGANLAYLVADKTSNSFKIVLNKPAPVDVTFSWIALAVNGAKTWSSKDTTTVAESTPQVSTPDVSLNSSTTGAISSDPSVSGGTSTLDQTQTQTPSDPAPATPAPASPDTSSPDTSSASAASQ
jgi:hypothetical protein